jgi:hypothetical protein
MRSGEIVQTAVDTGTSVHILLPVEFPTVLNQRRGEVLM